MSTARSRQQKRRGGRTPAVWRGASVPAPVMERERADRAEHGIRDEITISWRLFSGAIVACLTMVLLVFFATDLFYVSGIRLNGAQYLNESEVFRYADIAQRHIFWVDPDDVRQNLIDATPLIADARVQIGWPPDMVTITVQERQPVLLWVQGGIRMLVDVQGNVLRSPRDEEEFPGILIIIVDDSLTSPRLPNEPIPIDVVSGALQLQRTFSGLPNLRYNAKKGLGFREAGASWDVWLGTGTDMPNKLRVYETLRDNLLGRGITPVEINVGDLNSVVYCGSVELCYE